MNRLLRATGAIAIATAAALLLRRPCRRLRRSASADPLSPLDPQLNNHAGDRSVDLHYLGPAGGESRQQAAARPAQSWKALDDKTWSSLRRDVKWQDGKPFTAEDVIFSYQRARSVPGSVAPFAGYLRTVESVSAPDPYTLRIRTRIANPDLPLNLASVHIVSQHVGEKAATEDYNAGRAMVGTGPYKFVSYVPGERVMMARNDGYWGAAALAAGQLPLHQQWRGAHRGAAVGRRGRDRQGLGGRPRQAEASAQRQRLRLSACA